MRASMVSRMLVRTWRTLSGREHAAGRAGAGRRGGVRRRRSAAVGGLCAPLRGQPGRRGPGAGVARGVTAPFRSHDLAGCAATEGGSSAAWLCSSLQAGERAAELQENWVQCREQTERSALRCKNLCNNLSGSSACLLCISLPCAEVPVWTGPGSSGEPVPAAQRTAQAVPAPLHCIPERWGQVPRADVSAHLAQLAALYHRASPTLEAACATFAPLEGGDGAAAAQAGPGPACWEGPISGDPAAVRALARLHPARLLAADPDTGPGPWRQGAEPGAPRGALSTLWKAVWCLHTLRPCCACATSINVHCERGAHVDVSEQMHGQTC